MDIKQLSLITVTILISVLIITTGVLVLMDKLEPTNFMQVIITVLSIIGTIVTMANKRSEVHTQEIDTLKGFIEELIAIMTIFIIAILVSMTLGYILLR